MSVDGTELVDESDGELFSLMAMARTRNGGVAGAIEDLANETAMAVKPK